MDILTRLDILTRERLNKYFASSRLSKVLPENRNFTIISNDCWAGHVYRYFGLPYNTPTIGVGFFADDYLKFVKNLKYYLSKDLEMILPEESKHWNQIRNQGKMFQVCPYARIDDIEVRFSHYNSFEEVKEKWDKRRERMNWNNLIIKMSEHNDCTIEHLKSFDALDYDKKLVFTTRDYGLKSQVIYKEYEGKDDIINGTAHFRKYVDLIKLVNGEPFKK